MTAAARFDELVASFVGRPEVELGTGFGKAPGLRTGGKIFAMFVKDELVVKLPKTRVDELVENRAASQFDPGHGRLMKEWASVPVESAEDWRGLVDEAFAFVGR